MKCLWLYTILFIKCCKCNSQIGPDPWDYVNNDKSQLSSHEFDIPSDLKTITKNSFSSESSSVLGEWFYKRILAIVLKGGKVQTSEDDTIDITLQMKFDHEKWALLNEYLTTEKPFTENMFRRSIAYIEDAIYKPSITEEIVLAWSEYVQYYLMEYKVQLTWILSLIAVKVSLIWLWKYISHKHLILMLFLFLYLYEGFVSYKEAEKQEVERFLSAVNTCKWYIWTSECEVPPPDPIIFLKHMNPLRIGIRMFTILISEPIILISDTIKTLVNGITDGLWYPINTIMYVVLIVIFNVLLIFLLIMIIFNYILNMPFNLSFLGLISVGMKQRNRTFIHRENVEPERTETSDRISGATLDRILEVCSLALSTAEVKRKENSSNNMLQIKSARNTNLRRSASTGRLSGLRDELYGKGDMSALENNRENKLKHRGNGGGDAF